MTLFYCPLESYKERYTMQLSAPKTGWLERNWRKINLGYIRIEPQQAYTPGKVMAGQVLDAFGRSLHCFDQIRELLSFASSGGLTDKDVIYFDDFWHPGIEAIRYAFDVMGKQPPKMYANLWAQSVDEYDFTHAMEHWIRPFEVGIGKILDGIFVATPMLRRLCIEGGIGDEDSVHAVGHPFSTEEVLERCPRLSGLEQRVDQVLFTSRWCTEKNPQFFLDVAELVLCTMPHVKFIVCTGSTKLKSNDWRLISALERYQRRYPDNVLLRENLTKEGYYQLLFESKIQFNCASQDWISYTLLETSVCGCYPVYPNFRSFPEVLCNHSEFMYSHLDVQSAAEKITYVLQQNDLWTEEAIERRSWIHKRFDSTWKRMLCEMGLYFQEIRAGDRWYSSPFDSETGCIGVGE